MANAQAPMATCNARGMSGGEIETCGVRAQWFIPGAETASGEDAWL